MNKNAKTALIVALSLFGAGVLICLCVSVAIWFDYSKLNGGSSIKSSVGSKTIYVEKSIDRNGQSITLDLSSAEVTVEKSADDKIHISYNNTNITNFELNEDASKIELRQDQSGDSFFFNLSFFNDNSSKVVVSVPAGHEGELNINNASGSVSVSGVELLNSLNIVSVSGRVTVENIKAAAFDAKNSSGDIKLTGLSVESLAASAVSGNISVSEIPQSTPVTLETASGKVYAENVKSDKLLINTISGHVELAAVSRQSAKLSTTSGNVKLSALDFAETVFSSISGSIMGSVVGPSDDYMVYTSTQYGNNSLSSHRGRGEKTLDFTSTSGSFNIDFES